MSNDNVAKKLEFINKFRIVTPHQTTALDVMARCMGSTRHGGEPLSALITAASDSGKTETIRMFQRKHSDVEIEDRTLKPVVSIDLREVVSTKTFLGQILSELGEPFSKGNSPELGERVVHLLRELEVRLLVVDEAQTLFKEYNQDSLRKNADIIKTTIINNARVPTILFGVDDHSMAGFRKDPQIRRRFRHVEFPSYSYATADDRLDFRKLLFTIEKSLTVVEPYGLSDAKHADWVFKVTEGRFGAVMRLVREAARSAVEGNSRKIRRKDIDRGVEHTRDYS